MRDLILIGFLLASLLLAMRYPFLGLLLWAWFTLATPQMGAYRASMMPLNLLIAAATFGLVLFHQEFKRFRLEPISLTLIAFIVWIMVSQVFSLDPENSMQYTDRFIKVLAFVFLSMMLTTSKLRFHAMLWIFVAVMGFYGAKGGFYTLLTLARGTYTGLPSTVLYDNNHLGIAIATSLPIFLYMREQVVNKWIKWGITAVIGLSILAIFGTHSRGAFVALLAFAGFMWLRSNRKILFMVVALLIAIPSAMLLPTDYFDRMQTITTANEDASFTGRVDAWVINYKLAKANPFTGAGLRNPYELHIARSVELKREPRAAHSIYFEVLGGTGFIGLFIYLTLLGLSFMKAGWAHMKYRYAEQDRWRSRFGYYVQISMIVFGIGAASVSMEMWEGYLLLMALTSVLSKIKTEAPASIHATGRLSLKQKIAHTHRTAIAQEV
ncbi:MAG: putative O-glycosylation ligase, exosortase A system-associated [bacterium]